MSFRGVPRHATASVLATRHATALVLAALLAAGPALAGECPSFTKGSEGLPTQGEWRTHPVFGDVNGDGRPDLAGHPRKTRGPRVFLGDGKGAWKESSLGLAVAGLPCGVGLDLADVNGDGNLDLAVADHCAGIFVFMGDGKGAWKAGPAAMPLTRRGYEDVQFGDLDGDGNMDLVGVGAFQGGFAYFRGNGKGYWKRLGEEETGLPDHGYGRDLELADVNQDGALDLIATFVPRENRPKGVKRQFVWLRDGSGHYRISDTGLPVSMRAWGVGPGDLDGDGVLDLAIGGNGIKREGVKPLQVFRGNGGSSWTPVNEGLPEPAPGLVFEGVEIIDLNGDGRSELVAMSHKGGNVRIWQAGQNGASGAWTECTETGLPESTLGRPGYGIAFADVNRDGKLDLATAVGRSGEGSLEVWLQK